MGRNGLSGKRTLYGNHRKYILMVPLKWLGSNILLPLLPIAVKWVVNYFTTTKTVVLDPTDWLYYSFFICVLLVGLLKKRDTPFSYITSIIVFAIAIIDILLIAFVATGQQNPERVQKFALYAAITCAGFGIVYVTCQALVQAEREGERSE